MSQRGAVVERRHNHTLRELLEELVGLARDLARRSRGLSPEALDQAQERLEWLANEIGREAARLEQPQ
ncbi:MAG: hypothetical protein ACREMW_11035 [Gemmatimonadales bacterium]